MTLSPKNMKPPGEKLIADLLKVKRQYEKYFRTIEKPDNQAITAYTNVIKTAADLIKKFRETGEDFDPEKMKRIAEEILESDYGISPNRNETGK